VENREQWSGTTWEIEVARLPDFDGLAIFAKVVQMNSFAGAAAELQLSPATVSKAIGRVEEKFGTRLLNRTARRLALTEAGRRLFDLCPYSGRRRSRRGC
jgi:hypothetical protein